MFAHLYPPEPDAASQPPLAQHDGAPCSQAYSMTRLAPVETVIDNRSVTIPAGYPHASALLAVGVYAWPSLERLPITAAPRQLPDHRLLVAELQIVP
jgi:hypothetical protein